MNYPVTNSSRNENESDRHPRCRGDVVSVWRHNVIIYATSGCPRVRRPLSTGRRTKHRDVIAEQLIRIYGMAAFEQEVNK